MANRPQHTKEEFTKIFYQSKTMAEMIRSLGFSPGGATIRSVRNRIESLELDENKFAKWGRGIPSKRYPNTLEDLLVDGEPRSSGSLKARLIREAIFEKVCAICKGTEWMGEPIPLQLDHINGDRYNNTLQNLRLLCPNCHAQTPTFCGKNWKSESSRSRQAAILTEEQVEEIYVRRRAGEKLQPLADEFGVGIGAISRIGQQQTWKHITKDL